jgi:hypothetical protein
MHGAGPGWQPAQNLEEAERQLRELGVREVSYQGATLFLANTVNRCISELHQRGLELVPGVKTDAPWFVQTYHDQADQAVAMFDPASGFLVLNPDAEFWKSEEAADGILALAEENGFWSSGDRLQPVRHEYGHFLHGTRDPEKARQADQWAAAEEQAVALRVSRYAWVAPAEFVAEVFAGMLAGKRYDEDVMHLYQRYGGPAL